ncbi:AAA family ATPase [Actinokineospora inagensis]|uniref:AAA family ATPase n=1 Tax=Actinokineospora inagensis TaxID=103730 RepID=UPI0004215A96|nr:AAA family ATPase [Actinokineospora inagensis]
MNVERPVTIGVVGTHSTGKSTFLARLAAQLRRDQIQVATVADLGEHAQRIGLPILFNHTDISTTWFITRGISNELETWPHTDVTLVDRAVPDALGYYRAALAHRGHRPDPSTMLTLEAMVASHSRNYDLLFRTIMDPQIPLGANKKRDPNHDFRALADHHVHRVLDELRLPYQSLPADGHDTALTYAVEFTAARLSELQDTS